MSCYMFMETPETNSPSLTRRSQRRSSNFEIYTRNWIRLEWGRAVQWRSTIRIAFCQLEAPITATQACPMDAKQRSFNNRNAQCCVQRCGKILKTPIRDGTKGMC